MVEEAGKIARDRVRGHAWRELLEHPASDNAALRSQAAALVIGEA